MDEAIERHCQIIADAVDAFDGHLLKPRGEGDSTFSVFARSSNALRAAHRAQIALRQEQWPESAPIVVRFAVHAGEAIERDGDYFGSVVNRAARLRSIAQGGEILVSEAAAALVVDDLPMATGLEDLGPVHLRDLDREERVFALVADGLVVPTSLAASDADLDRSLEVRLLGPCELVSARGTLDLGGPKECATLALLSMANGPLSPDQLIDELWSGRPPTSARKTLQTYIWRLRRKLGDALTTVSGAYVLCSPVSDCDAVRFERLVREAHQAVDDGAVEQAGRQLDEALGLWRGQPFSGCASTVALESHSARLYERRIEAVETRLAMHLELGHHAEIVGELEAAVRDSPLREGLWSKLALALYRCDRAADALRTLARARRAIVDEAGLDPGPALRELEQAILEQRPELDFHRPPAAEDVLGPGPSDVAPLNPLVGRQREVTALMAMHRDHRLITVTGLGGCGKTHLVRAVAGELSSGRPVCLCELSLTSSGTAVVHAIARKAGLPLDRLGATGGPEDALIEHLRPRSQLLILDSCEHVLEACVPLVERLLGSCPRLQIVATSRIPLGVPGEQVMHLDPLPVPLDDRDVAADAVRLFVQRAAEARVGFTLTAENTAAVVEICRRLDGLPLGLELAAARMSALSAHEVVERMDRRFELLAARHDHGRRRTLLAALDWSHDLLSIEAQVLLRRLSIFSARFDASAIEASCGQHLGGRDVLDVLSELVDASLVVVVHEPVSTYHLLDTVRVYAARRLTDQAELDGCRAALGEWLGRRLDAVPWDARLLSLAFYDQLEDAHEELRATLEWAEARGHTDLVTRLVASMSGLLGYGRFVDEIAHWYPIAIEHERSLPPGERVATVLSAWAFVNVYGGGVAALVAQIDRLAALAENRPAHDVLTGFAYATLASLCSRLPDEQRPWEKYADLALEHTPSEGATRPEHGSLPEGTRHGLSR